ncbi:D-alanyl-D-alanine carboxypeptidase family protein [Turicibacter sanguinis]|uniref:D-alanyl-D-alanine carboxypeptidase family protein n=1 Tax=Turicibacter sanguinis TaxID=154288 RepID=UPI001E459A4F|nr:D-alanyl-D-alanine carboxypeptidase [Turicibacter sanguinis]MDB8460072.1 D-alanyl-D-alanine carboxypeptidase [Turicibacter sanguinis]
MRKWLMIVISLIVIMIGFMSVKFSNQLDNYTVQDTTFVDPIVDPIVDDSSWGVFSKHAILVDLKDNKILYAREADERTYPASLTKMMTVLVAIENLSTEMMKVPNDFSYLYEQNAALAGFLPGDLVRTSDLLYGIMLPSGADAALTVAENIAGSEAKFVKLMNEKSKELGMNNTHFTNVIGLHDNNHYTTVHDLAILLEYALKNPTFKKIFTTDIYTTAPTQYSDGMTFKSRLFSKIDSPNFNGGKLLGGKTGYTEEAELCLASLATDGKKEYILVTTNAEGGPYTEQTNILDAFNLYERFLGE